jgi:subtilisin family serine protease
MPWPDATGRGVRVAVIDSGIHVGHPHVGAVAGGAAIDRDGALSTDTTDRLGHGTAVAAAIREKAPDAELYAVRVFERSLATTITHLVRAIAWSIEARIDVINLSLGTPREAHAPMLAAVVAEAAARGVLIVSAQESEGTRYYPGCLAGVVPVRLDWTCPRDTYRVDESGAGVSFLASGYPRPIPGVPPEHNLKGISFAVANMSGFVARLRERAPGLPVEEAISCLRLGCEPAGFGTPTQLDHRAPSANVSPTRTASADVFA